MRAAVFDCHSGISGDMTLGAFLDAGLELAVLEREVRKVGLRGVRLGAKKVRRGAFVGTKFTVSTEAAPAHSAARHTPYSEIVRLLRRSRLAPVVKTLALEIFDRLARAESKVHGLSRAQVEFHEVGAVDSIVDIVGAAAAFHHWGIRKVFVRNLNAGAGDVGHGHHGKMRVPGPGAMELLKGFPVRFVSTKSELVTPTGAAILAALAETTEEVPALTVDRIGYGAGTADLKDRANLLRLTVGEIPEKKFSGDRILVLEANLDDMNPLGFEILYARLFQAGALDVFVVPVLMKKMRPAYKLSVLFEHARKDAVAAIVFAETTTFGVRFLEVDRFILDRSIVRVPTRFGRVAVKIGRANGIPGIASPEYEDCKKIALARRRPFAEVYREARERAAEWISGSARSGPRRAGRRKE
ncbi:MAG: nickel pincer cofactor biosynthesis protein LarC [Candidatus Omnitrophica bacterium]|nr:nickel pincer cofactor biosynthesis protein LarC [Candidatus Omnitrophota bacterium]